MCEGVLSLACVPRKRGSLTRNNRTYSCQSDLQKLNKRLAELPNKKELVYKESEKLRKCAYLLVLPCVRQVLRVRS